MANLVHRFLRNQSCLREISRLSPGLITHQKSCISNVESVSAKFDPVPLTNPVITVTETNPAESLCFYPSYPIGYGFIPTVIHASGLTEMASYTEALVKEKDEKEAVIYADSVKKRKKKINKHKYRKLRKLLGQKS